MAKNIDEALAKYAIQIMGTYVGATSLGTDDFNLKQALYSDILELIGTAEPCEPDCTPERHAYHEGQYQTILRQEQALKEYFNL